MTAASKVGKSTNRAQAKGKNQKGKTSPWEWADAALGALLIISALLYMTYYGLTHPSTPPDVTIEGAKRLSGHGWLSRRVRGEKSRQQHRRRSGCHRRATIRRGRGGKRETTLDYLPEQSRRRAGLFFQNDPRNHDLVLRAEGSRRVFQPPCPRARVLHGLLRGAGMTAG